MKRLLALVSTAIFAIISYAQNTQYQMVVYTDNGLTTKYLVSKIDSVTYIPIEESNGDDIGQNNEDETTVTGNASNITTYSATITAWANILDNLSTDLKIGIIYSSTGTPSKSVGSQKEVSIDVLDNEAKYTVKLEGLAPDTKYYYRSFVYQSGIWFYGDVKEFTTLSQGVDLSCSGVSKLTCYSAKATGSIHIADATQFSTLTYGICYGISPEPTVNDNKIQATEKDLDGNFTCQLRALAGSTTYYYRAYAYVDNYLSYGPVSSFTTKDDDVVITGDIDQSTLTVKSSLKIGSGAYSSLQIGVCYGSSDSLTLGNYYVITNEVDDENNYEITISEKIPYGTFYYRAFVLIDNVAHYGVVKSCQGNSVATGDIDLETYSVVSNIAYKNNNSSNTIYGICYGTDSIPLMNSSNSTYKRTYFIDSNNCFTIELRNIPCGTVYYRAFVAFDDSTYYGEIKSFEGNSVITGDIDLTDYSIKSRVSIGHQFYSSAIKYGICYGKTENPTINDRIVWVGYIDGEGDVFTLYLDNITYGTTYYRAYITLNGITTYGEIKSFEKKLPNVNGVSYVDLGLSALWCTYNVGASKPEEAGNYYAWGETETKDSYTWDTYKHGSESALTKYCLSSDYGTVDDKTVLELSDDAAHTVLGGDWHIPTKDDYQELFDNCYCSETTIEGIPGYQFTSRIKGYQDKSIFIPKSGYKLSSYIYDQLGFHYWTSSLYNESTNGDSNGAWKTIKDNQQRKFFNMSRYYGLQIRAICK